MMALVSCTEDKKIELGHFIDKKVILIEFLSIGPPSEILICATREAKTTAPILFSFCTEALLGLN
jgi:hypothetical protein